MKRLPKLLAWITGDPVEFSVPQLLLNFLIFTGAFVSIVALVADFFLNLPWPNLVFMVFVSLFYISLYFISQRKKHYTGVSIFFLLSILIFCAVNWFLNSGIDGPTVFVFLGGLVFTAILLKRTMSLLLFFLYFFVLSALVWGEYFYPGHFLSYVDRTSRFSDWYLTASYGCIFIFFSVWAVMRILETSQAKVEERTKGLQKTLGELQSAEAQLIQTEKLASLGHLIASVAHEISSPLTAIKAFSVNSMHSWEKTLAHLPQLLSRFNSEQLVLFWNLILIAQASHEPISNKEERLRRKTLEKTLLERKVRDAEEIAPLLVEMGVTAFGPEWDALLFSELAADSLLTAWHFSSLGRNFRSVSHSVDMMAKLVFALKNYSRVDRAGKTQSINLVDSIEIVLTLHQSQLRKGVEVVKTYEELPPIPCRPDELNQVWNNLIQNAIQAMHGRGTLTIQVKRLPLYVEISFQDTGPGVPEELRNKIFEAYFTTKPIGEGTGLGLEIAQRIVESHRGKLFLESPEEGGAKFVVQLPYQETEAES